MPIQQLESACECSVCLTKLAQPVKPGVNTPLVLKAFFLGAKMLSVHLVKTFNLCLWPDILRQAA